MGSKVNKYTMWLRSVPSQLKPDVKTAVPIHYEMKGFNNLLGSHYDHYYLSYEVRSAHYTSTNLTNHHHS